MTIQFSIQVKYDFKYRRFLVTHIPINQLEEHYEVKAVNKSIVLSCNRPLFRAKNLKKRQPDLKLIKGALSYQSFLAEIQTEILKWIKDAEEKELLK